MWSFRKEAHKIVATTGQGSIGCNGSINFSNFDQAGRYYTDVVIGSGIGLVVVECLSGSIPDRFQIMYDGVLVADSKLVGDHLSGNPPDADTALWEGGFGSGQFVGHVYNNLKDYVHDGIQFIDAGTTTNNTIAQSDVGDFGFTDGGTVTPIEVSFVKTISTPLVITVIVTAFPANTGFGFTPNCPIPEPVNIQLSTTTTSPTYTPNGVINGGGTLRWNATNGVVYGKTVDLPIFDFSTNAGTVDLYAYDTSSVTSFNVENKDITNIDVSGNINLLTLNVGNNNLTTLDITDNTLLTDLRCEGNALVAGDIDNILIQLDTNGLSNGFLNIPTGRTAASDAARTNLLGKSWTINEI